MAKKYISVETESDDMADKINLTNQDNEITAGVLKTKDENGNLKDVKEIFVSKTEVEGVGTIDTTAGNYTIETVATKLNQLINALKEASM